MTHRLFPCLWFDGNAKDAASLYCEVFPNSRILSDNPMVCDFELEGQKFMALNGGPHFKPNPSISFFVLYEDRDELKAAWDKLSEGGNVMMALDRYPWSEYYGWFSDKFGISWQFNLGKMDTVDGQRFTNCLMFTQNVAGRAEEAIHFYTSVFKDSKVEGILKYGPGEGDSTENIKHAQFVLNNQVFMAMDSSLEHKFTFNEGISLVVTCDTQEEIDYYWNKLTEGGAESQCGWLKDKFGVSWQIVPAVLRELMNDPQRSQKVVQAFMKMKKFDIQALLDA